MNTLDKIRKKRIVNECEKYTTRNIISGHMLFKLITSKTIVDNRSTTNHLREQLSSLDTYMYECGNDIIKFNIHAQNLELTLKARGQEVRDLILHLFKGYAVYSDETFRGYVEKKKYEYEDGEDTTSAKLMTFAENRYNNMKRDNVWNELSPDQEKDCGSNLYSEGVT